MNSNRVFSWLTPLLIPAIVLGQVGCSGTPGATDSSEPQSVSSAAQTPRDGESIFRGVFFGRGPVAALFPERWGGSKGIAPAVDVKNDELAASLAGEIGRMRAAGRSEDDVAGLVKVQAQLQDGSVDVSSLTKAGYDAVVGDAKIDRLIAAMKTIEPTFFDSFGRDMQTGDRPTVEDAFTRAQTLMRKASDVAGVGGKDGSLRGDCAVLMIWLVVMFWVTVERTQTSNPLERDEYVDVLAARLAAT